VKILGKSFYTDDPASVAKKLLGKLLVRMYYGKRLSGIIVETEAYYGREDPASRARRGGDLARVMHGEPGHALVYGVHRNWLFNIVAHEEGEVGAVLIRAIEPLEGIEVMKKLRKVNDLRKLTNGPGKLTKALAIDKSFHKLPVYTTKHGLWVEDYMDVKEVVVSKRIGVTEDLDIPLRFYVKGNRFVSKP